MVVKTYFILMVGKKENQHKKNELKIIEIISTHIIIVKPLLIKNA